MDDEVTKPTRSSDGRAVAPVLEQMQRESGFAVLHDLLVARPGLEGPVSAQLDHVVIDSAGVLVIETATRADAVILGTSSDAMWAAVYAGGRSESFPNPLLRLDEHLHLLNELLRDEGTFLSAEGVSGLVVMDAADLTELQLDSLNATRITTTDQLPGAYAARRDFPVGEPLTPEDQIALGATVAGLNRASAAHMAQTARAPETRATGSAVAPQSRGATSIAAPSPARGAAHPLRAALVAVLALAAVLTGVWGFQVLTGLRSRDDVVAPSPLPAERPAEAPVVEVPPAQPFPKEEQLPTVELAQEALREKEPQLYKQLSDPESPDVGDRDGYAAYTWEYVSRSTNSAIRVRTVTVLLSETGRFVRIERD